MNKEIWKDIKGFENLYQVSNFGRIKSYDKIVYVESNNQYVNFIAKKKYKSKIKKLKILPTNYIQVTLTKDNKNYYKYVHRLVAEAFIPNPNNLLEVNHKDSNRKNNCVDNLEWCSSKENKIHSILYGNRKPILLKYEEEIYQKLIKGKTVKELAEEYNVSTMPIMNIKRKRGLIK